MVSSTISEIYYVGNASLVTGYSVGFPYLSASHVKVQKLTAGTGTVSITAGLATFTSAQATLLTGSRFRISGTTYTIFSKTSTTVFTLTTEPTVASSAFHIIDDATDLVSGSTYTLVEVGVGAPYVTTAPAIAATDLVRVYRELPLTQLTDYPATGPLSTTDLEDSLDEKTMQIQQVSNRIDDLSVITNAAVSTTANDTTTFADNAARAAATPTRIGQLGIQLDTNNLYRGSATTAGSWTQVSRASSQYHASSLSTLTPDFVGQIGVIGASGGVDANTVQYGSSVGLGLWSTASVRNTNYTWQYRPWLAGDPLVPGQRRWAGTTPVQCNGIVDARVSCDTAGAVGGDIRIHMINLGSEMTTDVIYMDPELAGSGQLAAQLHANVQDTIAAGSRIEIEVVSVGAGVSVTSTAGSTVSTPDSGDLPDVTTGVTITTPEETNAFTVFVRGDGTIVRSHPAATTGTENLIGGKRVFVRGVETGAITGGIVTIPATATDLRFIHEGDRVVGPTIPAGTTVVSKGVSSFVISAPTTGATTLVTVVSEQRPPIMHFKVISEAAGQTVIEVPTTTNIRVGDRVVGEFIPDGAYVTVVTSNTSITISSAVSGGTATEVTVAPPERVATVTAGTATIALAHTTGLLVGSKVTGPGVPEETYITAISSPNITVNKNLMLDLAGASTDLVEITREKIQVVGTTTAASTTIDLPYAVNTTPIAVGMSVSGPGIPPGTLVAAVAASAVTISKSTIVSASSQNFVFIEAGPAIWSGLELTIIGSYDRTSFL